MKKKEVNCVSCKYYYITWDDRFPYGCKAIGFKCRNLPCVEILRISGQKCLSYQAKPR